MELMKGGKSEEPDRYSDEDGKKMDAMVAQAHALFKKWATNAEPGMICDAVLASAASAIGSGFTNKEAFDRNFVRLVEGFGCVMKAAFERAEAMRRFTPQG